MITLPPKVNAVNMIVMSDSRGGGRPRYHHGDLRNALLQTALRLVAEKGPESFSLREAARSVGVSPAAAYRHFADKATLLGALAEDGHARLAAAMERGLEELGGRRGTKARAIAAVEAIAGGYVEFAVSHPAHFRVMFGPYRQRQGRRAEPPSERSSIQILIAMFDELADAGLITAKARAAGGAEIAAWSSVHGLSSLLVEGALDLDSEGRASVVRAMARTLLIGLGCDPSMIRPSPPPPPLDACARAAVRGAPSSEPRR